ncbi:Isoprenoid synthase domain superfamily protein [Pleurotus pulmonarius]
MDAIRHPNRPRPSSEWVIGEMARQFWANAVLVASPTSQVRFVDSCQTYLDALVQQAEDRAQGRVRHIEDYFTVRRGSIGAAPSIAIGALYLNIPQETLDHPVISKLTEICIDMIIIGNDMYSYKVEWERGDDGHNLITVIMHQFRTDVQDAMHHVANLHARLLNQFLEQWNCVPVFGGPIDSEIRTYCNMLGNWVRANDSWSFESERYYGKRGLEIETTRLVQIYARHDIPSS